MEKDTSSASCMVSISDTDNTANVEFHKSTDENWADYRIPVGASGPSPSDSLVGLMPLKMFVGSEKDTKGVRLLVCVKWVSNSDEDPKSDRFKTDWISERCKENRSIHYKLHDDELGR